MKLYMFRTVRLSIIGILFTVHSAMVYVIPKFHKWVRITSVYIYIYIYIYSVVKILKIKKKEPTCY
jgi:hypothetical protein